MHELKATRVQALTTREMAQIGLFTALIAAGAYIKVNIPVQPFPMHFTMQFLFVLLAGFLLGAKKGAICVGIYLAVGLSGIPVFAAGGGPAYLIRPTFGFLLGFVFAAWITGKLSSLRLGAGTAWDLFSAFWGMMAYYVSWKLVVINCFLITVMEDFLLCVMAAFLAKRIRALAGDMFWN